MGGSACSPSPPGEEEGSDEGSGEETESEDLSSSEEESEDEDFDDSVCPPGCDQSLFDLAIRRREQRLDLEESLAGRNRYLHAVPPSNYHTFLPTYQRRGRQRKQ